MSRIRTIPQITEAGTRALVRALGYADAVRYIAALRSGTSNYTTDRRALLKKIGPDELLKQVADVQAKAASISKPRGRKKTA